MPDRVVLRFYGDASIGTRIRQVLEQGGLESTYIGPQPLEQRGAGADALAWFALYVTNRVVDVAIGGHIDRVAREAAEIAASQLRARYPSLRIQIDPPASDAPARRFDPGIQ